MQDEENRVALLESEAVHLTERTVIPVALAVDSVRVLSQALVTFVTGLHLKEGEDPSGLIGAVAYEARHQPFVERSIDDRT